MDKCDLPEAWLFDCYPHPRSSHIVVWIKHGTRVTKRLIPYQPDFCIKAEQSSLAEAEAILAKDDRVECTYPSESRLWLRGPTHPVLRVRPKRFQDLHRIATDLRRITHSKGYTFFDVDNQPESRWLHDNGLWSMCRLQIGPNGPILKAAADEKRFTYDYPTPDLRTIHLRVLVDAEGTTRDDVEFNDNLVGIKLCDTIIEVGTIGDDDAERDTLIAFHKHMQRLNPDVILTQHGDRFDVPFLISRIKRLGLQNTIWLGREPDPIVGSPDQKSKSIHTYGRWLFKTAAYYLRGRWHIDLSKKTLDSEDDRKDIHGILYLARVSSRRPQDCNRNGAGYALQQMQIDYAQDMGVAIPWKRNLVEDWKDAATLCAVDRGGQIMVPTPGIYGDVAACDFSGYYPNLIVTHNLSSDSINCECCPDGEMVPELGYHVCNKQMGHQATVLARLNPHRKRAKGVLKLAITNPNLDPDHVAKAQAIKSEHKALGVVCFGYFRYRNARFGCAEVHQAIQCYGRQGMTQARELAHADGYELVHTMTDCTFIQRPGITRADALKIARKISVKVGVSMDLEGIYRWVVFLPSKVHSHSEPGAVGVPNRYFGKFRSGKLKVRGIDVQKHSTPDWIRDVQWAMLHIFEEADTPDEFLARIPRALRVAKQAALDLRHHLVDARALGTVIQSTKAVEDYTAQTNARTALLRLRDAGTERKPGEYLKYVVTRQEGPKEGRVVPIELFDAQSPWFGDAHLTYSVAHYCRLLARSVETILAPFGYWEDALFDWFMGKAKRPVPSRQTRVDLPVRPEWITA